MNQTLDYFSFRTAKDLFAELKSAFDEFYKNPNDRLLMFIIFTSNHLREWIAEKKWSEIEKIPKEKRNDAENFSGDIFNLEEFKIINNLCNRSKHFITKHQKNSTSISSGASSGLSKAGDSLSQYYYLVNNRDVRDILFAVISKYDEWFNNKS